MLIFPAIDIIGGEAVRLYKGEYDKKTVFGKDPVEIALKMKGQGATHLHLVDLDGAKAGYPVNLELIKNIKDKSGMFCEVGGGIRDYGSVKKYIEAGLDRVIIGTAAVTDAEFLKRIVGEFEDKIAVGIDVKDGFVAVKGWTEKTTETLIEFSAKMQSTGVKTVICTDVSKDGAMCGTNLDMYRELAEKTSLNVTASGGVSSIKDVVELRKLDIYGTIIGKAYYTGDINLTEAIETAK